MLINCREYGVTSIGLSSILPCPSFYPAPCENQTIQLCVGVQSCPAAKLKTPLDISPFCLYHNFSMIPTQETRHPRQFLEETYYWFSCSVPGCNQHHDMEHGYYAIIRGKREEGANKLHCPQCSLRPYLAMRGATNEVNLALRERGMPV